MLNLLQGLVGSKLDVFISGKIFTEQIITTDSGASVLVFQTVDNTNYYFNIDSIDAVRLS
jgi:uncharacterized protein (DUF427 family)